MKDENTYTTEPVQLEWDDKNRGRFFITMNEQEVAKMIIGRDGNDVIVYHTEVVPEAEGKGLAKKLLESMVAYVRDNNLQVVALSLMYFYNLKGILKCTQTFGKINRRNKNRNAIFIVEKNKIFYGYKMACTFL